jgi:signal transduction histidine kinase
MSEGLKSRGGRGPRPGTPRVWALTAVLALASAGLYALLVRDIAVPVGPFRIPWWALAAMFCLSEILVVHVHFREDAYAFSLSEIPLVIGLFTATPGGLVLGQILGSAAALALYRQQSPGKLAFNVSHFALEATLALTVFRLFPIADPFDLLAWGASFVAVFLAALTADVTVGVAVSLTQGDMLLRRIGAGLVFGKVASVANASVGLVGTMLLWTEPRATWLLAVPVGALFLAYAAHLSQRKRHQRLELLYSSTRIFNDRTETNGAMVDLLTRARETFRAAVAEITLVPSKEGYSATRTAVGLGNGCEIMRPVTPHPALWDTVVVRGQSLLLRRPMGDDPVGVYLRSRGFHDAVVAPLRGGGGVLGLMLVANRLGDSDTFDGEDLRLLEALAHEAGAGESISRLADLNRIKDDFLATVSHELRTPLTSVVGCAKTLRQSDVELDADTRAALLEVIDRQSGRLGLLVEDLLAASRLDSVGLRPVVAPVSLEALASQVVEDFRPRIPSHDLVLRVEGRIPVVPTDERKVRQVLSNLVENARKYSPPSTTIGVTVEASTKGIRLAVEDQGPGIPGHLREKIFERFYQVDPSSGSTDGMGLGLYICRQLAGVLGGRMTVEPAGSTGSVFTLWIPLVPPEDAIGSGREAPAASEALVDLGDGRLGAPGDAGPAGRSHPNGFGPHGRSRTPHSGGDRRGSGTAPAALTLGPGGDAARS